MPSLRSRVIAQAKKTNALRSRLIANRKKGLRARRLRRAYLRNLAALRDLRLQLSRERSPRRRAYKWAAAQVGKTEWRGPNDSPDIRRWQRHTARGATYLDGAPYCGIGCENACAHAGVDTTPGWAAVAQIEDLARASKGGFQGWTDSPTRVRLGDLVVLFGRGIHVELVVKVKGGNVHTIGFNTSSGNTGSQANGGGVYRRVRPLSSVHGFALVAYPN